MTHGVKSLLNEKYLSCLLLNFLIQQWINYLHLQSFKMINYEKLSSAFYCITN